MAAEAWPSIRCTTFTLAPAEIDSEAAVCRSACAVTRGNGVSATRQRSTAPDSHDLFEAGGPRGPPLRDGQINSVRSLPSQVTANWSTTYPASATVRCCPDLRLPTWVR